MPAWVWFTVAGVAALAGAGLLVADYAQRTAQSRERHRWANLRGWRFVESDPLLPDRWRHGVIAQGGAGEARDLVSGRLFTAGATASRTRPAISPGLAGRNSALGSISNRTVVSSSSS